MTLYLHIGTQKTGTTALQSTFYENRDRLKQSSLIYVDVERSDSNKVSHYNSVRGFFSDKHKEIVATKSFVDRVNSLDGDILISAESLSSWPAKFVGEDPDLYWQRKRDALVGMRKAFAGQHVKVIYCTRRPEDFLKSLFNQHLKVRTRPSRSLDAALEQFLKREIHKIDYARQASVWREVFADVNVIDYDQHRASGLLSEFLRVMDRDLVLDEPKRKNVSEDWASLEMRRITTTFGCSVGTMAADDRSKFNQVAEKYIVARISKALAGAKLS